VKDTKMNEQIITTPGGERLVVIPEAEYRALREALEDREDLRAIDEFHRRFAAGEEELVPSEVVNRLVDGENPVRVWREYRRLSARDLAEKAGLSAAYLSEIENGKKTGSIGRLRAIAAALGLTVDDLG
jgi:DNA-binding XRE family transcriptional regulator